MKCRAGGSGDGHMRESLLFTTRPAVTARRYAAMGHSALLGPNRLRSEYGRMNTLVESIGSVATLS